MESPRGIIAISFLWGCILVSTPLLISASSFQGLGDLPGGIFWSRAHAVSDDGSVIVGAGISDAGTQAFRWSASTGMNNLNAPGNAWAVSDDGSVIAGDQFRWSLTHGAQPFPGAVYGVSADGSVLVGQSDSAPFRWTENEGLSQLTAFPGGIAYGAAYDISADGQVIVGYSYNAFDYGEASRWSSPLGILGLGASWESSAAAVAADGSVVIGTDWGPPSGQYQAFRWTASQGRIPLGSPPDAAPEYHTWASDLSADGSLIVGKYDDALNNGTQAFIWNSDLGIQNLYEVLTLQCRLDLTGWQLLEATGISADGHIISGYGINPQGHTEAWVAHIPEPSSFLLLTLGLFLLRKPH